MFIGKYKRFRLYNALYFTANNHRAISSSAISFACSNTFSSLPVLKVLMRQGVPAIDGERFSKHATSVLAGDILQVKIGKKEFSGIRAE